MEVEMKLLELFSHWDQVRSGLYTLIDQFDERELDHDPFPGSWSVKEILLHIANAEEGWFQYIVGGKLGRWPDDYPAADYLDGSLIKSKLVEVHQATMDDLNNLGIDSLNKEINFPGGGKTTLGWVTWHVIEHEIHHRGELSLILGILGKEGIDV